MVRALQRHWLERLRDAPRRLRGRWANATPARRIAWSSVAVGWFVLAIADFAAIDADARPAAAPLLLASVLLLGPAVLLSRRSGYVYAIAWALFVTTNAFRAHEQAVWQLPAYFVVLALFAAAEWLGRTGRSRPG